MVLWLFPLERNLKCDIRSNVVRESWFASASPRWLSVRPRFAQESSFECSGTRTDPVCVLVVPTSLPDGVSVSNIRTRYVAVHVSRLRRDKTFLAPLLFQAQSGHTEAHGDCEVLHTS